MASAATNPRRNLDLVVQAVQSLAEPRGSSLPSIYKYLKSNSVSTVLTPKAEIVKSLIKGVKNGLLKPTHGRFLIPDKDVFHKYRRAKTSDRRRRAEANMSSCGGGGKRRSSGKKTSSKRSRSKSGGRKARRSGSRKALFRANTNLLLWYFCIICYIEHHISLLFFHYIEHSHL